MKKKQAWLVFQPEGVDVLYLWNGSTVYLMFVDQYEGEHKDWYWQHDPEGKSEIDELGPIEIATLNDAMNNPRKKVFTIQRKNRRYIVISRDRYLYEPKE